MTRRRATPEWPGLLTAALAAGAAGLVVAGAAWRRRRRQDEDPHVVLSTAAHELRTPLTSLHLRIDLLREVLAADAPDLDDAREQVERATVQSRALIALANELLRLDGAGTAGRRREPVELAALARAVMAEFERVRAPSVELEAPAAGAVWALGDPSGVTQILRILLDNALRFAPADTTVTVLVRRTGRRCEVTVRDWGPGVAAGDRKRIFGRFERAGRPGPHAGFGLGLAIARDLARRFGGDLRLSSAARPTSFTLELRASVRWPPGRARGPRRAVRSDRDA